MKGLKYQTDSLSVQESEVVAAELPSMVLSQHNSPGLFYLSLTFSLA